MNMTQTGTKPKTGKRWAVLLGLLALAVFMYVSIMYKIVNFGA